MSHYDHSTLMSLKLERWREDRFLPHQRRRPEDWRPEPIAACERRESWRVKVVRWLSRRRHVRT